MWELKGTLQNISRDYVSNGFLVTFHCEEVAGYKEYLGKVVSILVKTFRKKRSLTANAYYWVLVRELAKKQKLTQARLHNMNLRNMCPLVYETLDGAPIGITIKDTEEAENEALDSPTVHIYPTDKTLVNSRGTVFRQYYMLKGSHDYDTEEMARLISNIVEECKAQGIETLPPYELERLVNEWEKERKHTDD